MDTLIGSRVVRGPDWKWNDQDGGEGGVGTIVSTDTLSDGKPVNQQTVLVRWDNGHQADYRLGQDGEQNLRILDSTCLGICFNGVMCNGCRQHPLLGTRWKCADCDDYDLCTHCYNNDTHDAKHNFTRYDHCDLKSTFVCQRSSAVKVQAKGIFPGSDVTSGKDSVDELGLAIGRVIMDHQMNGDIPVGKVLVEWRMDSDSAVDIEHNVGFEGKVDLKLDRFAPGVYYYRDHLMIPVYETDEFAVGDKVTVHLDINVLHQIISASTFGCWEAEMERGITKVGVVDNVDGGLVVVRYETLKDTLLLMFPPIALSKVHELRIKDKVTISNCQEKVQGLQKGHKGWVDDMEKVLGEKGEVIEVDEKGDARVRAGEDTWWFNPASLILESKEEDRQPAPTTMMTDSVEDEKSSKKSFPEKISKIGAQIGSGFETFVKAVTDKEIMSSALEECVTLWKNVLPITVTIGKQEGDTRLAEAPANNQEAIFTTADVKDPLEGQACAPLLSTKRVEELESSDEDEDEDEEGVFVRTASLDKFHWYNQPPRAKYVYKMTSVPRGFAIIVNIQKYDIDDPGHPMYGKLEDRVGSEKDDHLKFMVETINNTTADKLLAELKRISTEYYFHDSDCFVLFIMSHGAKDCIYASDGEPLTPSLVMSLFRKCKGLAGKPKLFFFQGCRGKKEDRGVSLADAPGDTIKTLPTNSTSDSDEFAETADTLEFHSSYSGYKSYRYPETGSPFVQSIVEVFRKNAYRHPISKLVTKVTKRMNEKFERQESQSH